MVSTIAVYWNVCVRVCVTKCGSLSAMLHASCALVFSAHVLHVYVLYVYALYVDVLYVYVLHLLQVLQVLVVQVLVSVVWVLWVWVVWVLFRRGVGWEREWRWGWRRWLGYWL